MKRKHRRDRRRPRRLALERFEARNLLATLELGAAADNTIYESLQPLSNGVGDHLFAGRTDALGGFTARRGLIRFDVSSIAPDSTINSVSLQLTASLAAPFSGDREVAVHRVLTEWGEGNSHAPGAEGRGAPSQLNDASWFHRLNPIQWQQQGGDINPVARATTTVSEVFVPTAFTWSSDELVEDVREWINNPDINHGWMIIGDESDIKTARRFESRENTTEANRPKLIIDYTAVDTMPPTPVITGPAGLTNADPVSVAIDFGEVVNGFDTQDITVTGGTITNLADNGNGKFTATIDVATDGTLTVAIPTDIATDEAGNANLEATPYSVDVDITAPIPVISGPASPSLFSSFDVTIDFGETVNGFEPADIVITNGTVTNLVDNTGGQFIASVTGTFGTTMTIDIAANVATDPATNPNEAASTFSIDLQQPTLDFGDAPSTYPVTLAADGARHTVGTLFLGASVDAEPDGTPTAAANGDGGDEDGFRAITTIVSSSVATASSLSVTASAAGRLDGWVDFNQDGDWNDPGEQVITNLAVIAGENVVPINIPARARSGFSVARLRLSSVGGLGTTGQADDGEVEDHRFTLAAATAFPTVGVQMIDSRINIDVDQGHLRIVDSNVQRFRAPVGFIDELEIIGTSNDDVIGIDLASFQIPTDGMLLRGNAGVNVIELTGDGASFDFTQSNVQISNFRRIDLSAADETAISLDPAAIAELSPIDVEIELFLGVGDEVAIDSASDWRLMDPIVVDNQFRLVAEKQLSIERIEAVSARPWQNFVNLFDANNNGAITANDALVIINELARRSFSASNGTLKDPLDVPQWPGFYYDQNGDGNASALDALRIINRIALISNGGGGAPEGLSAAEGEAVESESSPSVTIEILADRDDKVRSFSIQETTTPREIKVGDAAPVDTDSVDQALQQWSL